MGGQHPSQPLNPTSIFYQAQKSTEEILVTVLLKLLY